MISSISVGNFKAFGKTQKVPLRPITLLFGPNSSGKSSFIHSLLWANHIVQTGEFNVHHTKLGGTTVDLGGPGCFIHRRNEDNSITLLFEVDVSSKPDQKDEDKEKAPVFPFQTDEPVTVGVNIGKDEQLAEKWRELADSGPTWENSVSVQRFWIQIGEHEVIAMNRSEPVDSLTLFDHSHPAVWQAIKDVVTGFTTLTALSAEDEELIKPLIDELVLRMDGDIDGLFPSTVTLDHPHAPLRPHDLFRTKTDDLRRRKETLSINMVTVSRDSHKEDLANALEIFIPRMIASAIDSVCNTIRRDLSSVIYLGPLRSTPPRHLAFQNDEMNINAAADGTQAYHLLMDTPLLRKDVNAFLSRPNMKTHYKIDITNLVPLGGIQNKIADRLKSILLDTSVRTDENLSAEIHDLQEQLAVELKEVHILETQRSTLQEILNTYPDKSHDLDAIVEQLRRMYGEEMDAAGQELIKEGDIPEDFLIDFNQEPWGFCEDLRGLEPAGRLILENSIRLRFLDEILGNVLLHWEMMEELGIDESDVKEELFHIDHYLYSRIAQYRTRRELTELWEKLIFSSPEDALDKSLFLAGQVSDTEREALSIIDSIERSNISKERDLVITDLKTSTNVSLRDVGIGVSQVIPVIVYTRLFLNSIIAIEQPELHLHPAMQAELGDLFIGSIRGQQPSRLLIETHSEHIILRLLRRIRQTTEGKVPKHLQLKPEDVSVLYAEPTEEGTVLHHLEITPDGDFAKDWPEGFFEERDRELFS